jgi:hypothetical protein
VDTPGRRASGAAETGTISRSGDAAAAFHVMTTSGERGVDATSDDDAHRPVDSRRVPPSMK